MLILKIIFYGILGAFLGIILNFIVQISLLSWLSRYGEVGYWPVGLNIYLLPFFTVGLCTGICNALTEKNRMTLNIIFWVLLTSTICAQIGFGILVIWFNIIYQQKTLNMLVSDYRANDFWNAATHEGWLTIIPLMFVFWGIFLGVKLGLIYHPMNLFNKVVNWFENALTPKD